MKRELVRYIAFLRAINVGGKKLIRMEDLKRVFEHSGFKNVRTFIQSGNVIFEAAENDANTLARKIEKQLLKLLGHEVAVLLRTMAEVEDILKHNPFKRITPGPEIMMFVTFLSEEPRSEPRLPLISATENLEVFQIRNRTAFILARHKKNGWFGYPNNFVEKQLRVLATTRNWTTVRKIVDFAARPEASR
jgi:uncharacterized protein (DUF1697 family)